MLLGTQPEMKLKLLIFNLVILIIVLGYYKVWKCVKKKAKKYLKSLQLFQTTMEQAIIN